jgi:hypothetical protein
VLFFAPLREILCLTAIHSYLLPKRQQPKLSSLSSAILANAIFREGHGLPATFFLQAVNLDSI